MESLYEIQFNVESFLKNKSSRKTSSLWERLIQSAIKFKGKGGCDAILMEEAENYTKELLAKLNDKEMNHIWQQTESGILSAEQGFLGTDRYEMIYDISLDVNQSIVDNICQEAKSILKKK